MSWKAEQLWVPLSQGAEVVYIYWQGLTALSDKAQAPAPRSQSQQAGQHCQWTCQQAGVPQRGLHRQRTRALSSQSCWALRQQMERSSSLAFSRGPLPWCSTRSGKPVICAEHDCVACLHSANAECVWFRCWPV